jgi:hypothetical protein
MTRGSRRNHSAAFKAKVALAPLKSEERWCSCRRVTYGPDDAALPAISNGTSCETLRRSRAGQAGNVVATAAAPMQDADRIRFGKPDTDVAAYRLWLSSSTAQFAKLAPRHLNHARTRATVCRSSRGNKWAHNVAHAASTSGSAQVGIFWDRGGYGGLHQRQESAQHPRA